jgi:hypothetical protein
MCTQKVELVGVGSTASSTHGDRLVRCGRILAEGRSVEYAELAIWNYRKSRALGNWLGIVSGSG